MKIARTSCRPLWFAARHEVTYGGSLPLPWEPPAPALTLQERAGGWDADLPSDGEGGGAVAMKAAALALSVTFDAVRVRHRRVRIVDQPFDITSSVRKRRRCMT